MNQLFSFGTILAAAATLLAAPVPAEPLSRIQTAQPKALKPEDFVYQAVLAGLTEDGVPLEMAGTLAGRPDFFAKCSLCNPTHRAFEEYAKRKDADKPKEGKGLTDKLAKNLKSDDNDTRRAALRELIAGYMDRGYERLSVSAEGRTMLEKELLAMRSVPKSNVDPSGFKFKFCPSCDGACRILKEK